MSSGYLWVKAFHVIFVITWMAGLFYLPRLFVYHASATDSIGIERFKLMESKLYRVIMLPSMLLALGLGVWMIILGWSALATSGWLWVKLALVTVLLGYHHYCARLMRAFAADANEHSERFYRIFNEVPALLLIAIVILAIVKPF